MDRPKHAGLRHLALNTRNLEAMQRFYVDFLGFAIEWQPDPDNVYLTWEWQRAWWTIHPRGQLLLVAAEREDRVVAVAPFYVDHGMISFVGQSRDVFPHRQIISADAEPKGRREERQLMFIGKAVQFQKRNVDDAGQFSGTEKGLHCASLAAAQSAEGTSNSWTHCRSLANARRSAWKRHFAPSRNVCSDATQDLQLCVNAHQRATRWCR